MSAIDPFLSVNPSVYLQAVSLLQARSEEILARHGAKAFLASRAEAAAHEAGHVVALAASNRLPLRSWIESERIFLGPRATRQRVKTWNGKTIFVGTPEGRIERTRAAVALCPADILRLAVGALAGLHGEEIYGVVRPRAGSSLDEILVAESVCSQYADASSLSAEMIFAEVRELTRKLLSDNLRTGRAIAATLDRNRSIEADEIATLCRNVPPFDIGAYLSQRFGAAPDVAEVQEVLPPS